MAKPTEHGQPTETCPQREREGAAPPARRRRGLVLRVGVSAGIVLTGLVLAELALQAVLFSDVEAFAALRNPGRYADYFSSDDYWKLYHELGGQWPPPAEPHPVLGWIGAFARDTYVHHSTHELRGRRPVLLYGDSCAQGVAAARPLHEILNAEGRFSERHYLLNYGVGGYGVDQTYLLLQHSIDRYDDPFVVFSLMTFDLDRTILSVREGQKPRFRIEGGRLLPPSEPIQPDSAAFFAANPPRIRSYLWACLVHSRLCPDALSRILSGEDEVIAEKEALNGAILEAVLRELRSRGLDFVFVIFHPNWPGVSTPGTDDWRNRFLRRFLAEHDVPYVWSTDAIGDGEDPAPYYLPDSHPTTRFNEAIAARIARAVLGS